MPRDPFHAIADPTRRAILDLLAEAPRDAQDVADRFDVSRPAISRHLRVLRECGLVRVQRHGRRRRYHAHLGGLAEPAAWIARHQRFWSDRLDALESALSSPPSTDPPDHD